MEKTTPPHVVIIHLDLGIGGAESLVLNLAKATLPADSDVYTTDNGEGEFPLSEFGTLSIYTTHCSPTHCYDEFCPQSLRQTKSVGSLASYVHVRGAWIPRSFRLGGTALCSSLRMLYLTHRAYKENPGGNIFVIDVLPTGVPYLVDFCHVNAGVVFYCHFPDKLLTRDTDNHVKNLSLWKTSTFFLFLVRLRRAYRWVMDGIEEWSMSYCDLIVVNSYFTRGEVQRVFPSLFRTIDYCDNDASADSSDDRVKVLYPSIESSLAKQKNLKNKMKSTENMLLLDDALFVGPIVSLNRFERKKNVALLLHAYDILLQRATNSECGAVTMVSLPSLIIAGGYDPLNVENVEHLTELRALADQILSRYDLNKSTLYHSNRTDAIIDDMLLQKGTDAPLKRGPCIVFLPSITNTRRTQLLASASVWVYTPYLEHFGIVPLEAMDAGVPVVAVDSGGPRETIVDGVTGFLIDSSDNAVLNTSQITLGEYPIVTGFANAISKLLSDKPMAMDMGKRGRERVDKNFGMVSFRKQWWEQLNDAQHRGAWRYHRGCTLYSIVGFSVMRMMWDAFFAICFALIWSWALKLGDWKTSNIS